MTRPKQRSKKFFFDKYLKLTKQQNNWHREPMTDEQILFVNEFNYKLKTEHKFKEEFEAYKKQLILKKLNKTTF